MVKSKSRPARPSRRPAQAQKKRPTADGARTDASLKSLQKALRHHQTGDLQKAEKLYRKVLKSDPDHVGANHLFGVLCYQNGRSEFAIQLINKALASRPDFAEAHNNLGIALRAVGKLREAGEHFTKVGQLRPDMVEAHVNLAMTCNDLGDHDKAVEACEQALTVKPDSVDAAYNFGNALRGLGRHEEALVKYRQTVAARPGFSHAFYNMGNTLSDLARFGEAVAAYDKAIELESAYGDALNNRGNALRRLGRLGEAYESFRRALKISPGEAKYQMSLYELLLVHHLAITEFSTEIKEAVTSLLSTPGLALLQLSDTWLPSFWKDPEFRYLCELVDLADYDAFSRRFDELTDLSALQSPFFILGLKRLKFADRRFERLMTWLRRRALLNQTGLGVPFLGALAAQCFFNEHVWSESDEEAAALDDLIAHLGSGELSVREIVILACYRPLHRLAGHEGLQERFGEDADPELAELLRVQIEEPRLEAEIRQQIPTLGPIDNTVSVRVREQYEQNPYPRWLNLDQVPAVSLADAMAGLFPHLGTEELYDRPNPRILIAGCGTGCHALQTSVRFQHSNTLAVDLSLTSLAYAVRKARELGLSNVEFKQADILNLAQLDETFDIIESVGVLHHMEDPMAGWRVLAGLLKPDGFMKIGLYSELGRRHVVAARELIAEHGYESTLSGIRHCREHIYALPPGHPASGVVGCPDFYTTSDCRDFIFHTQEHRFTLEQIGVSIEQLELEFLGFDVMSDVLDQRFAVLYPGDDARRSLEHWAAFEAQYPESFSSMYQFWVRRKKETAGG